MSKYDLNAMRAAGEAACMAAFDARETITGAINWADLHCVAAERYESTYGAGYRIYVEEASPGQQALGEVINSHMEVAGFHGVEIVFEW